MIGSPRWWVLLAMGVGLAALAISGLTILGIEAIWGRGLGMLVLFFALASAADWVTIKWHRAREHKRAAATSVLSMLLETLTWVPVWFALTLEDPWIAVVSIVGSGAGTWIGMRGAETRR